jgi:DNA-directed RNA polymerase specialized sigma24 family protein
MSWANAKKFLSLSNPLSKQLSNLLSKLIWRNGPMTTPRSALTLLADHLATTSRRAEGADALERFAAAGLDLSDTGDLEAVVHQCRPPGEKPRRDEVLGILVPLAPQDEVAAQCALVVLRPELGRMARLLARGALDLEEAQSEMVAIGWEVVTESRSWGPRTAVPATVVNAIWTEARRAAGLRRRGLIEVVALGEDFEVPAPDVDLLERWPGLLATAVAHGVLTPRQLVIIAQSRMEGRPLTEVAAALRRPWGTVYQERRRGEEALRKFALAYNSPELP